MNKKSSGPWETTFGSGPVSRTVRNSLIVGSGAYLLGMLSRAMEQKRVADKPYYGVDVNKSVNTVVNEPVIPKSILKELTSGKDSDEVLGVPKKSALDTRELLSWTAPVAAGTLGYALGSKLFDKKYDTDTNVRLKEQNALLSNLHKKIIAARALNARGKLSDDVFQSLVSEAEPLLAKAAKARGTTTDDTLMAASGLLMSTALALSAYGAHKYFSARNPNNMKYKAINKGMKEYALNNSLMRPIEQQLTDDPETGKLIAELVRGSKTPISETPIAYTPVTL